MNNLQSFLRCFYILLICLTTSFPITANGQDLTFSLIPAFHFEGGRYSFIKDDLDFDGIDELYTDITYRVDGVPYHSVAKFLQNRKVFETSLNLGHRCQLYIFDFNMDRIRDFVVCVISDLMTLEVFYGPDYDSDLVELNYYDGKVCAGYDRILVNGESIPNIIASALLINEYESNDSSFIECWSSGRIWQGTWEDGRPLPIADICLPYSFTIRYSEDHRTYYFAAGFNEFIMNADFPDTIIEADDVFFSMFTNYRREYDQPDSIFMYRGPGGVDEGYDAFRSFGFCFSNIVKDIDGDSELDWVQPYWTRAGYDTFDIHVPVYDPVSLEVLREYTERVESIYVPIDRPPKPLIGVAAVNIDEDDTWEILLAIQGQPLRIIDPVTMELIMSSEFIVPDMIIHTFLTGKFDERNLYQLIIYDGDRQVCYDFPENWRSPHKTEENKIPQPQIFTLNPAYPNPFNAATTTLSYTLPRRLDVELSVWDATGRKISVLDRGRRGGGEYRLHWRAEGLSSGVYFVKLKSAGWEDVRKVNLVR